MRTARLWPLAAPTMLLAGCAPAVSQAAAQDKALAGLIWAGIIFLLILLILSVIRRLHAKGAAWQVTYLGANLTAALGIFLLFTIIGTALLPASLALRAVGVGATVGAAWFVLSAVNLAPEDSDRAGLFWFFLGRNGRSRRSATQKQPEKSPEPCIEEPSSTPAEQVFFKSSPPPPALEPPKVVYKIPLVMAPEVTPEVTPAVTPAVTRAVALAVAPKVVMSASPTADNQYVPESAPKLAENPDDDKRCPHGHRRREYCPICDIEGFREFWGDWRSD